MFIRLFIIIFSTSIACLVVAMALETANPLSVFKIADIVILTGSIITTPSIIYGYFKGSVMWDQGVRIYKPYLYTALKAALANGIALALLMGTPWMEGRLLIIPLFLGAFACGGVIASALSYCLMQSWEKHGVKFHPASPKN